jgi:hypothetical protein
VWAFLARIAVWIVVELLLIHLLRLVTWPFRWLFRKLAIGRGLGEAARELSDRDGEA